MHVQSCVQTDPCSKALLFTYAFAPNGTVLTSFSYGKKKEPHAGLSMKPGENSCGVMRRPACMSA